LSNLGKTDKINENDFDEYTEWSISIEIDNSREEFHISWKEASCQMKKELILEFYQIKKERRFTKAKGEKEIAETLDQLKSGS
jgi:hypothetical protein